MNKACAFIGHREIENYEQVYAKVYNLVEHLIKENIADTFYIGSKSTFNSLCTDVVGKLKEKYPHIERIYIRAEFQYINKEYEQNLLKSFDKTYFSKVAENSGRVSYIKRNNEMIDKSNIVIFYYDESYSPSKKRNSGTKLAYIYAEKKKKKIINIKKLM